MSHASGSSTRSNIAYMAKHHPRPIESASGCTAATAAPAPRHLTILIAAEAVADRCMFRSVSSVPVIWAGVSHSSDDAIVCKVLSSQPTANKLAVVTPVRNCMMIITEICYIHCQSIGIIVKSIVSRPYRSGHQRQPISQSAQATDNYEHVSPLEACLLDGKIRLVSVE